jgi:hypothetical protein
MCFEICRQGVHFRLVITMLLPLCCNLNVLPCSRSHQKTCGNACYVAMTTRKPATPGLSISDQQQISISSPFTVPWFMTCEHFRSVALGADNSYLKWCSLRVASHFLFLGFCCAYQEVPLHSGSSACVTIVTDSRLYFAETGFVW